MLVATLDKMWGLDDLEPNVTWDFARHLWSFAIDSRGEKEVINQTRNVLSKTSRIYLLNSSTSLKSWKQR